ncbi:putative C-_U-editing enzyme APOBEC-4 [Chanos chanos]|uniref:C->U-editing enzyme APOBEC-4 n=1 Tax=Chanos chanos TaxID=29144 RepID=A0A6J2W7P4_CHACN|nr:putative C->U-editing enzyme APOBEC-4 [Chanos chanos]
MWVQVSSCRGCLECPQHIHTDANTLVSFSEFCQAFGFPSGPAGANTLLLFYELWSQNGVLVQKGRASDCPHLGYHPETVLFGPHGYLFSVLEEHEEVSSILLYSNYTPCMEPPNWCVDSVLNFLERHPWIRLDLFFSQLHNPQNPQNQAGLRSLASLWPRVTLSPLSGNAWGALIRRFVKDAPPSATRDPLPLGRTAADRLNATRLSAITGIGPAFMDLTPREDTRPGAPRAKAQPLILLPPPHLHTRRIHTPARQEPASPRPRPQRPLLRPINVVRHVRMPPPRPVQLTPPLESSTPPPLLLPGRVVEVVQLVDKEAETDSSSKRSSKRGWFKFRKTK